MKKVILGILIGIVVLGISGVVVGKIIPANEKAGDNSVAINNVAGGSVLTLPSLEKIVYIHYKKGFGKPGTECGNGVCEPSENKNNCPADCGGGEEPPEEPSSSCYGFLANGVKLTTTEDLVIHPDLDVSTILTATQEWDDNTTTSLFGSYTVDDTANWDSQVPDGRNEFSFGNYPQEGVIGVAIVWGYFSGPPWTRRITEFDILFDTDFVWGDADLNPEVMDLENIAVHEIGHGVGLADIYDGSCAEVTMYGYSGEGETKKRSLEQADITGLQSLYGN